MHGEYAWISWQQQSPRSRRLREAWPPTTLLVLLYSFIPPRNLKSTARTLEFLGLPELLATGSRFEEILR